MRSPNARQRYELGTKVSLAATLDGGFILGARSMPGNPYDGHTLAEALEQVEILTGHRPALAVVDRGYRGHGVETTRVLISGTRRGITPVLAKLLRRQSAIEPSPMMLEPLAHSLATGHMKTDGRLARCPLKGTAGDAIFIRRGARTVAHRARTDGAAMGDRTAPHSPAPAATTSARSSPTSGPSCPCCWRPCSPPSAAPNHATATSPPPDQVVQGELIRRSCTTSA